MDTPPSSEQPPTPTPTPDGQPPDSDLPPASNPDGQPGKQDGAVIHSGIFLVLSCYPTIILVILMKIKVCSSLNILLHAFWTL